MELEKEKENASPLKIEPSVDKVMNRIMEATRLQEARDAMIRERKEAKKAQRNQQKADQTRAQLSPEWKVPLNEFKCSQVRKMTANGIMEMLSKGEITDDEAEAELKKLEEEKNRKKLSPEDNERSALLIQKLIQDNIIAIEQDAPIDMNSKETGHNHPTY